MRYFPIFYDLRDRDVVVVGGGEESLRKIRLLLKTEARIAVIAETLHAELASEPRVHWLSRRYEDRFLDGAALVYSADPRLNETVTAAAKARGIAVNAVDNPGLSTFIVPSIVDRSPVVVAIGTEGTAPMLGQGLRARLDATLPQSIGALARAAGQLRQRVAGAIPPGNRRRAFWQRFLFGDVRDAFIAGESANHAAGVEALFNSDPAPVLGRVTFVSTGSGDPEMLTLKAHRKLMEADVIVHDRNVGASLLETARRDAIRIAVDGVLFDGTDATLVREARQGRHAVRLTLAEASLEERVSVAAEGVAIELVPGVGQTPVEQHDTETGPLISFPLCQALLRAAS